MRQTKNRVHVTGPARQMHGDHGSGARRYRLGEGLGRDILTNRIDIGENRRAAAHENRACRGDEGTARHHDLIARTDPQSVQCQFQGQTAVGHGNAVFTAAGASEFFFKASTFCPGPVVHLAGAQHPRGSLNLLVDEVRPGGKRRRADGSAALNGQMRRR